MALSGWEGRVRGRSVRSSFEFWSVHVLAFGLFVLLLLLAGCAPGAAPVRNGATGAPRLTADLTGVEAWLNSPPIESLTELQGKVVLLDFWTYSCVNCIRTLPYLKAWHERYKDEGLVLLGVHTPEFNFEKSFPNVERATTELEVPWPVGLDNERKTWDAFRVRAWPTKVLLGPDGRERARVVGEGQYEELEQKIRLLLVEAGTDVRDEPSELTDPDYGPYRGLTREIYAGWRWEISGGAPYLANPGTSRFDEVATFTDPGPPRANGLYFLHGVWERLGESVRHARQTQEYEDYIAITYTAGTVFAVIGLAGEEPLRVLVTLDGMPLTEENKGADVVVDSGKSYLVVQQPRMYEIVAGKAIERRELRLSPLSEAFALHTFTFGP